MNDTELNFDSIRATGESIVANGSGDVPKPVSPWAALMGSRGGAEPVYEYDAQVDIATLRLKNCAQIVESDDTIPGIVVDLDVEGRAVGVEIFDFARIAESLGFSRIGVTNQPFYRNVRNGVDSE